MSNIYIYIQSSMEVRQTNIEVELSALNLSYIAFVDISF